MGYGQRLKLVRGSMLQEEFAKILDVHKNTVVRFESEKGKPNIEELNKVLTAFPDINPTWLLTGEGEMNRGAARGDGGEGFATAVPGRRHDDAYVDIPLYDVRASAGAGALVEHERIIDFLQFKAEWIRVELRATPKDLYLIHVDGESMEPTLRPGDMILVDHRGAISVPRDGIYVMRIGETLLVKRLQRLPGNALEVTSDNPAYKPFTIKMDQMGQEDMAIIGRVVWCGRRM